jgi:hypothetical protein
VRIRTANNRRRRRERREAELERQIHAELMAAVSRILEGVIMERASARLVAEVRGFQYLMQTIDDSLGIIAEGVRSAAASVH